MDVQKIRQDFPVLDVKVRGKPIVYFDNACVSLKPRQVVEAMDGYYYEYTACHGRSVHYFSKRTTEEYEKAREKIGKFIGAKPKECIFTKNTTEGINIAANSLELEGKKVITTNMEHNSNLIPWRYLAQKGKIKHEMTLVTKDGEFDLADFEKKIDGNTKLVSVIHTSNVMGTTMPLKEICKISHDHGALVLADGAQAVPHQPVNMKKLDVDFYAFSGHKMLGPSGTGVLYGKSELLEKMHPFMVGGETIKNVNTKEFIFEDVPAKFEPGLQNYGGAIGFGAAVDYLGKIGMDNVEKQERHLTKKMLGGLSKLPITLYGPKDADKRGGVFAFNAGSLDPHELAILLDETDNIFIRSGMHCAHMYHQDFLGVKKGTARASLYIYNTEEEIDFFFDKLGNLLKHIG